MNEEIVKKLIFDVILKAAVKKIIAAFPVFGFPVINPIFLYFLNKLANHIYSELAEKVGFYLIDLKTEEEKQEYEKAVVVLQKIHNTGTATKEEVERAKENFRKTLGDLIRLSP